MPAKHPAKKKNVRRPLPVWMMAAAVIILLGVAVLIYFLTANSRKLVVQPTRAGFTPSPTLTAEVSVEDAYQLMGGKNVVFLDVRSAATFQAFHIQTAINIPVDVLSAKLDLVAKGNTVIIFDDYGGEPAQSAYAMLKQAGFAKVGWVTGGMEAWVAKNFPYVGTGRY
jgi:rhodanese-related sulfurtransferase